MIFNSPPAKPLGLADGYRREKLHEGVAMRIIAHNGAAIVGGAELALIRLLRGLQQRGHEVTLCCNHDVVADESVRRLVPAVLMPLRGDLVLTDATAFEKFLRRDRPDALLLGTFKKIWLGGLAASRAGVPRTVARVGLASDTPRRFKYRVALERFIDLVILNAEAMRADFLAGLPGYDRSRVITIHNGVTPPQRTLPDGAIRGQAGIPALAPVVGTVARLSRQKRLDRLIDAVRPLADVHCIIAGEGSENAKLKERVQQAGIGERVHFLGHRTDLGDVLSAMDIFVVSSDQEGMSNAMLEALWAGVPVISTPVSGAHEALEPLPGGQAPGRVVESFTAEALQRAIDQLLSDRPELRRMSVAAEARARERFDFERMVTEYEAALRGGPVGTDGTV